MLKYVFGASICLALVFSCKNNRSSEQAPSEQVEELGFNESDSQRSLSQGDLLAAEHIASLSVAELSAQLGGRVQPRNAVELYRISYHTVDPNGLAVEASGLIALPATKQAHYPLIALQHGTISSQADAPSVNPRQGILEASQGFMVAAQDYIGFGSSAATTHPYLIRDAYVQSGLDMIRATRQFAEQNEFNILVFFLSGYSEGGYASLAMQKAIETQDHLREEFLHDDFRLLASAPAAGPYNLSLTAVRSLAMEVVNPVYLLKVVQAYLKWYPAIEADYDRFFQASSFGVGDNEALQVKIDQDLLGGRWRVGEILNKISSVTSDLVESTYLEFMQSVEFDEDNQVIEPQQDPTGLLSKLEANNLASAWAPTIPTRLYHCIGDEIVPVEVATATVEKFKKIDSSSPVSQVIINDASYRHGNCPAIISPLDWFGSLLPSRH